MELGDLLENLKRVCLKVDSSRAEIKSAIEKVLVWLNEPSNDTDANCRKVDLYVLLEIRLVERQKLSEDLESLLYARGGQLYDTHTAPDLAKNFESTPRQLLERARQLQE